MAQQSSIQCPSCGTSIDVNDILKHQIEDALRKEFQQKSNAQTAEWELKNEAFEKARLEFETKKKKENELFQERLEKAREEFELKTKKEKFVSCVFRRKLFRFFY